MIFKIYFTYKGVEDSVIIQEIDPDHVRAVFVEMLKVRGLKLEDLESYHSRRLDV